jgi:hypothetical protein
MWQSDVHFRSDELYKNEYQGECPSKQEQAQ